MHVHLDKKLSDGVAIAFIVITLSHLPHVLWPPSSDGYR